MRKIIQTNSKSRKLISAYVRSTLARHIGLSPRLSETQQASSFQRHYKACQRVMKIKSFRILLGIFFALVLTQPTIAQPLPDGLYYTIQQKSSGRYVDAYTGNQHDSRAVLRHVQFNDTQKWQFAPVPGYTDVYTIQQLSNSRFLDAYENNTNGNDYGVMTRPQENNTTQWWRLIAQGNDTYRVQQQSTEHFLDAHDDSYNDFALVTRNQQDDDSQQWVIKAVELKGTYLIQHNETGRRVDAYEDNGNDYAMVHRPKQKNLSQRWEFTPLGNNTYTIKQRSSGRFVDAYTDNNNGHNFGMVTRNQQNNDTQKWIVTPIGNDTFTLQQKSNGRYADAYVSNHDFALVTRDPQNDGSQVWKIIPQLTGTYTIQQKSNERYLDAHTDNDNGADYKLVTNPAQNNDTQHWLFTPLDGDTYTIQQWNNSRFMDAYTSSAKDYRLVNRPLQTDDSQKWTLTYLGGDSYRIQQKSSSRFMDAYQNDGYEVVTRNLQNNDSQQWLINRASIPNHGVAYGSASLVSGEGLSSVTDTIDDLVLEYLRKNKIPGATVAASRDGKLIMSKGYGYKSVETKAPMQPTSLTRIGSVSKVLTAIGFMKLSEQTPWLSPETRIYGQTGALSHPSYMSAIFAQQIEHEDPSPLDWYVNMKVNHLLSHTAGFNKVGKATVAAAIGINANDVSFRQIHQYNLENLNLKFEPGSQKTYKNHHMSTVGQIIEDITGQLYRNYITSSVLTPLGLTSVIPEDGITLGLDSEPHTLTHSGTSASVIDVNPTTTAIAAGGWMASAESMVRLMVATDKLSNQPDILSPDSINLMETTPYPNATGDKYALGWAIACQDENATTPPCRLGHNGKVSGGYAYITKFLEGYDLDGQDVSGINVAMLINMNKGGGVKALTWEIAKLIGNAYIPPGYDLFWSGSILTQGQAN